MLKVVFMDAGGVLFNNVLEETPFLASIADRYGLEERQFTRQVHVNAPLYESGRYHVHDVFRRIVGSDLNAKWLDELYLECVEPHRPNLAVVRQLRDSHPGVRIILTNNESAHWDELKNAEFGHYRLFDRLLSSWRVRQVKPSEDYFAELCRACPATESALLVDDRRAVLRVGARLGMRVLHVHSPEVLAQRLAVELDRPRSEAS
ncbi:HAD family hydrolase [Actinokineospora spheciospongiae]|uniref:HAD family hydrolase n=1 Tax=Actinokineospora spheciospongiae TaxID=909613 RepID=UPI000D70BB11|nr:HAD family hydrolase [Actinokineospora spheciospongiae]PWW60366.1 putative hydrolase of the HAD superfamily [Actinokineospora spheciospongiae]